MSYVLYVVFLVLAGLALIAGYVYIVIRFKLKVKWTIVPALVLVLIAIISIDLGLNGSKLFIIQTDYSLKTSIIFSSDEFEFSNGEFVELIADGDSYVINDAMQDFFIEEIEYGVVLFEPLADPFIEAHSATKVPFRILDYYGVDDEPIASIHVKNSSGALHYWLREANEDEVFQFEQ